MVRRNEDMGVESFSLAIEQSTSKAGNFVLFPEKSRENPGNVALGAAPRSRIGGHQHFSTRIAVPGMYLANAGECWRLMMASQCQGTSVVSVVIGLDGKEARSAIVINVNKDTVENGSRAAWGPLSL